MAGKVGFGGEVMKAKNGGGGIPAVQGQARRSRPGAGIRGQLKAEVGVSAKHIDFGKILSERDAQKQKGCQSEVDKIFHVPCNASRKWQKRTTDPTRKRSDQHGVRPRPALPDTTYPPGAACLPAMLAPDCGE